jgi:hypothetical protein
VKKILLVLLVAGCTPSSTSFEIIPSASAAVPDQVLKLALSQTVSAAVWSATAGTITQTGTYTAPPCSTALPQTVTITAAAGGFTATATVTVDDKVTGITITPATVAMAPNATQQFAATVKSLCNPTGTVSVLRVAAPVSRAVKK